MTAPAFAPALVRLLQGPLYSDAGTAWDLLLRHRQAVEDFFAQLDLEVLIAEHDGLAFLRKRRQAEEESGGGSQDRAQPLVPELVARHSLRYLASVLCVLLAERLYQFESSSGEQARLVLDRPAILEMMAPFLPSQTNEARQADAIDAQVNNLVRYGFLRRLEGNDDRLEVTRLLKYKIDADAIGRMREKLAAHVGEVDGPPGEGSGASAAAANGAAAPVGAADLKLGPSEAVDEL